MLLSYPRPPKHQQPVARSIDLSIFNSPYQEAPSGRPASHAPASGELAPVFDRVPDGLYHITVDRVELSTTRTSGLPILKWRFRIAEGPYTNRLIFKNSVITERSLPYLKKEMKILGLALEPFSMLPEVLAGLSGIHLIVKSVTREEGRNNVYIDRCLSPIPDSGVTGDLAVLDDDLPF